MGSYGVGQGLADGVKTAGQFLIPVLQGNAERKSRESLFDKQLAALAAREGAPMPGGGATPGGSPMAPATRGGSPMPGATPGESLIAANGMPSPMPAPAQVPLQQSMPAPMPGMTPGAAMAQPQDPNEPMSPQQVYDMFSKTRAERLSNQTRVADEIDVAQNWQKNHAFTNNLLRSMNVIQAAVTSKDPNQVLALTPGTDDPAQAREMLLAEQLKLRHQYDLAKDEFKMWDKRLTELGIDPNEIMNPPDIAQYINRLQAQQRSGRSGGRSVVPRPSRSGVSR